MLIAVVMIGLCAGFLSSMLGVGGGVILVPALMAVVGLSIHEAVAVSLAVIIPTAFAGFCNYYIAGYGNLHLTLLAAGGAIVGAYFGASLGQYLPAETLKKIFGCLLILVGSDILFGWTARS